jgi:hypothetical protein
MSGQYGVEQVGKVLDVVVEGGNVAEEVIKGQGVLGKITPVGQLLDELMALSSLDGAKLKLEVGEIDSADKAALVERFKAKFDLEDDHVEGLVEEGLGLASAAHDLIAASIAFAKKVKAGKGA